LALPQSVGPVYHPASFAADAALSQGDLHGLLPVFPCQSAPDPCRTLYQRGWDKRGPFDRKPTRKRQITNR
jgi:hypothetical protein